MFAGHAKGGYLSLRHRFYMLTYYNAIVSPCQVVSASRRGRVLRRGGKRRARYPEEGGVPHPVAYNLSGSNAANHPTVLASEELGRLLAERTDGAITIDVFSGGVLGGETTVLEQVQLGATAMTRVSGAMMANVDETFNALFLPDVWEGRDEMFAALDGELGEYFSNSARESGLGILAWFDAGTRNFYTSVGPIYSPDDLQGLSIRTMETPLMHSLTEAFGASPVGLPAPDVYSAIQTGVVDGAEHNPLVWLNNNHSEVAPYFSFTHHLIIPEPVLINVDIWDSLSVEHQEIFRQAALEAAVYQRQLWHQAEQEAIETAIAAGASVNEITAEQRAAFAALALPVLDDFAHIQYHIDMVRDAQR